MNSGSAWPFRRVRWQEDRDAGSRGESKFGRDSAENLRATCRGGCLTVEFSSDEPGSGDLRLTLAYGGLHIARQEGMKNVVSQEGHEQKAFDGAGVMLEDVIGVPFCAGGSVVALIQSLVF